MTDPELYGVVRQGERYWIAARQDEDLVVRHLHLNYAAAYFELALHGALRGRIRAVTGADIDRLLSAVQAEQDRVQRRMLEACGSPLLRSVP